MMSSYPPLVVAGCKWDLTCVFQVMLDSLLGVTGEALACYIPQHVRSHHDRCMLRKTARFPQRGQALAVTICGHHSANFL